MRDGSSRSERRLAAGVVLGAAVLVALVAWDLPLCRGKRCAQLADRFVPDPHLRAL